MIKILYKPEKSGVSTIDIVNGVGETYPLHTHEFYEFFLVTKGKAFHVVNGVSHLVERGTLVFIRPSDYHCYDFYRSNDFQIYNRGFSNELLNSIYDLYKEKMDDLLNRPIPKHIKLDEATFFFLESEFKKFKRLSDNDIKDTILKMLINTIIGKMIVGDEYDNNATPPDWFTDLLDYMNNPEHFIEGLPCMLEHCNYSQEHINREFKKYLSSTPTKYINELRLRYAAYLLTNTSDNIILIAEKCGFNNLSHFNAKFKELYNTTPREFKQKI